MMKTIALAASAAVAFTAAPVQAWWDNGHMLVGQVAAQLMDPADVATLEKALSAWEADFPNTNQIASAAIWPDLVKCSANASYCNIADKLPSFSAMDRWHYVNLPLFTNGYRWGNAEPDLTLFTQSFGGDAADVIDMFLKTFDTSKSLWTVNLGLRQLIHIFGDVHNPMHAVGAVSTTNPKGDQGGNLYKFQAPCVGANLHALYDAAGGELINNWAPKWDYQDALKANATELIKSLPIIEDTVSLESLKSLSYKDFLDAFIKGSYFKKIVLESYNTAVKFVYPALDLTYVAQNTVACPPDWYVKWSTQISKFRIALAGKRLSVILTQVAKKLRSQPALNLA